MATRSWAECRTRSKPPSPAQVRPQRRIVAVRTVPSSCSLSSNKKCSPLLFFKKKTENTKNTCANRPTSIELRERARASGWYRKVEQLPCMNACAVRQRREATMASTTDNDAEALRARRCQKDDSDREMKMRDVRRNRKRRPSAAHVTRGVDRLFASSIQPTAVELSHNTGH